MRGSANRRQLHAGHFDEISCSFSQSVKRVIGVEIIENAVEDAKANAQLNGELKNIPNFLSLFYWLNSDYFIVCLALQELQTPSLFAVKQKISLLMCSRTCREKQKLSALWTLLAQDCVSKQAYQVQITFTLGNKVL